VTVWVSFKSTSAKAMEPPTVSITEEPVVFASSVMAPLVTLNEPVTMVGASFEPVTVMVTGAVTVAPWESFTVTL
jgi:hypothetical protein